MKTILLRGFDASVTEESVRSWLERFGPVQIIAIHREGNAAAPIVRVEMEISDSGATYLTSRISGYWHQGSAISAHLLMH